MTVLASNGGKLEEMKQLFAEPPFGKNCTAYAGRICMRSLLFTEPVDLGLYMTAILRDGTR